MFIKLVPVKRNTDSAVYLVQGYRDKENKVKHRKIKLYGFLSDLEKEDPYILEKLKKTDDWCLMLVNNLFSSS